MQDAYESDDDTEQMDILEEGEILKKRRIGDNNNIIQVTTSSKPMDAPRRKKKAKPAKIADDKPPKRKQSDLNLFILYCKEQYYPLKKGSFEKIPLQVVRYYFEKRHGDSVNNSFYYEVCNNYYKKKLKKITHRFHTTDSFVTDDNDEYVLTKDGKKIVEYIKIKNEDGTTSTKMDKNNNPVTKKVRFLVPKERPAIVSPNTTNGDVMMALLFFEEHAFRPESQNYKIDDDFVIKFMEEGNLTMKWHILDIVKQRGLDITSLQKYGCVYVDDTVVPEEQYQNVS